MSANDPSVELEYPLENGRQPATQFWSENYALVLGDPQSGVALLYSAGTWYQDTRIWRENLVISLPDGSILVSRNFGRRPPCQAVGASLSRYEVLQPLAQARLQFDGPATGHDLRGLLHAGAIGGRTHRVQLAALFAAGAPMWDMHAGDGHDATSIAGSMHIEQLGRCDGELVVDGRSYAIRGAQSCRDHSRGVRNVAPYRNHCWINGQFAGGRGFQLYVFRMHGIEGLALSRAVITEQGRQHPATVEEIEFVESAADIGRHQSLRLRSELGVMSVRVTAVQATLPIAMTAPFNSSAGVLAGAHALIFDEPVQLEWNGERGYGWSERGFAARPLG